MDIGFRPLERADLVILARWLAAPHVARWWREDATPEAVEASYGPSVDGRDPTELFVVEVDGEPVGMVQRYRLEDEPSWAAAIGTTDGVGIDYLIGVEELTGKGIGARMIDAFTTMTFERYPDVDRVVVAVQQENAPSWRALENAGYRRVFAGTIASGDPSDEGPSYLYVRPR